MTRKVRGPAAFSADEETETELNEYPSGELRLDDPERGRVGDPRSPEDEESEFPPERVREAGLSGASAPDTDATADEATPETLLSEEPSHTPTAAKDQPADTILSEVDETEIGGGYGLDEAELAEEDPLDGRGRE